MKKNKLKVEVFFPFASCTCTYAPLLEKVGRVTAKFKDSVDLKMRSTKSPEAKEYGLLDSCVMVDGTIKLPPSFDEEKLEELIVSRLHFAEGE